PGFVPPAHERLGIVRDPLGRDVVEGIVKDLNLSGKKKEQALAAAKAHKENVVKLMEQARGRAGEDERDPEPRGVQGDPSDPGYSPQGEGRPGVRDPRRQSEKARPAEEVIRQPGRRSRRGP